MKKIVLLLVILATTFFVVVSPVNADALHRVIATDVAYGCVHKDYYQNLSKVISEGDKEAFVKGLLNAYQLSECKILEKGTPVYLTDTSIWAGLARVRPEGSMDEYWTSYYSTIEAQ